MAASTGDCTACQPRRLYAYVVRPRFYNDHHDIDHQNNQEGRISIAFTKASRRSIHTTDNLIKGVVHVKAEIPIKEVVIKFVGKTVSQIIDERRPKDLYTATTELFCFERSLNPREIPSPSCPPGRVEYTFEFHFPKIVEQKPTLQNNVPYTPSDIFEHEEGFQLPPSFWWNGDAVRNEYFLEAELFTEHSCPLSKSKVIQQLRFSPSIAEELALDSPPAFVALSTYFTRKSWLPSPTPACERRGSLEKIKATFRRGSCPEETSYTSTLVLGVPSEYQVGSEAHLTVASEARHGDCALQLAPVYIRRIRAQAIAHIRYRVPTASAPNGEMRRHEIEEFDLFNQAYSKPGVEVNESTRLGGFEIDKIIPPTFKSYGVALTYDVRYTLTIDCAGKVSEHEMEMKCIPILPMTRIADGLGPPEGPPPEDETTTYGGRPLEAILRTDALQDVVTDVPPPYYQ